VRRAIFRGRPTGLRLSGVTTAPEAVQRDAHPVEPNRLWVADAAVANTGGGPLYIAAVLDCCSHRCVGWWLERRCRPRLLSSAVEQAVWRSRSLRSELMPRPRRDVTLALPSRWEAVGVTVPPGASPAPSDGAVSRTFFAMLRSDMLGDPRWATRTGGAEVIAFWIERLYNRSNVPPLRAQVA
jgi:putative transposase